MKRSVVLLSLLCLATLNVRADWQGEAKADFAVKATMDSCVGKATSEPIALAADATALPVTFQIAKLDTGKKKRDVEMQHMFHMEQHPELTGVAKLAGKFELLFVNDFGLPFNTGNFVYGALLIALIVWGLMWSQRSGRVVLNTIILGVTVVKLFLVDLSGIGTVARIVSFIGVGLLILLIAFLAPAPHKAEVEEMAAKA